MTSTLENMLRERIAGYAKIGAPCIAERYVLRNGKFYPGAPYRGRRRAAKNCFGNATALLELGLDYVEGFALRPMLGLAVSHAWNVDGDGVVQDSTWNDPADCEYFGVRFPHDLVWREILATGYYGLLDGPTPHRAIEFMCGLDAGLRDEVEAAIPSGARYFAERPSNANVNVEVTL